MSMVDKNQIARHVEEVLFVSMVDKNQIARQVEAVLFVSMVDGKTQCKACKGSAICAGRQNQVAHCVNSASIKSKQWTVQLVK